MEKITIKFSGNAKIGIFRKDCNDIFIDDNAKNGKVVLIKNSILSTLIVGKYYEIRFPSFLELEKCLILSGNFSLAEEIEVSIHNKYNMETFPIIKMVREFGFSLSVLISFEKDFILKEIKNCDYILTRKEEYEVPNNFSQEQGPLFEKFMNGGLKKLYSSPEHKDKTINNIMNYSLEKYHYDKWFIDGEILEKNRFLENDRYFQNILVLEGIKVRGKVYNIDFSEIEKNIFYFNSSSVEYVDEDEEGIFFYKILVRDCYLYEDIKDLSLIEKNETPDRDLGNSRSFGPHGWYTHKNIIRGEHESKYQGTFSGLKYKFLVNQKNGGSPASFRIF